MGIPFDGNSPPPKPPPPPPPASSSDDDEGLLEDEEDDEAYLHQQEWQDPSEGGVLSRVLTAAEVGDTASLRALLPELSVSIDTPGEGGDTALHLASLYGNESAALALLEAGARADVRDEDGAVCLHDAAAGGYAALAAALLAAAPATRDVADTDGDTPLHNAARALADEVVALLLDAGANPRARNFRGLTPRDLADVGSRAASLLLAAERAAEDARAAEVARANE